MFGNLQDFLNGLALAERLVTAVESIAADIKTLVAEEE